MGEKQTIPKLTSRWAIPFVTLKHTSHWLFEGMKKKLNIIQNILIGSKNIYNFLAKSTNYKESVFGNNSL